MNSKYSNKQLNNLKLGEYSKNDYIHNINSFELSLGITKEDLQKNHAKSVN